MLSSLNLKVIQAIFAGWFVLSVPGVCHAGETAALPEVKDYSLAIKKLSRSKKRQSIEPVFTQAKVIAAKLMFSTVSGRPECPLAALEEPAYESLKKDLPGFFLEREVFTSAFPEPEYFSRLAAQKGLKVDQAFFSLSLRTYKGVWPVYIRQQTDESGCTRYGEKIFPRVYKDWIQFGSKFPGAYKAYVEEALNEIAEKLTEGTCACGDKESVLSEFQGFVKAFPLSPISAKLIKRIKAIQDGTSKMRFKC